MVLKCFYQKKIVTRATIAPHHQEFSQPTKAARGPAFSSHLPTRVGYVLYRCGLSQIFIGIPKFGNEEANQSQISMVRANIW
jgi:hypothetical protein